VHRTPGRSQSPSRLITQGIPLAWHRSQGSYGPRLASNSRSPKTCVPPPALAAAPPLSHPPPHPVEALASSAGGPAATSRVILAWTSSTFHRVPNFGQQVVTELGLECHLWALLASYPTTRFALTSSAMALVPPLLPLPPQTVHPWPSILQILFTDPAYQSTQVRVGFPHHRCLR